MVIMALDHVRDYMSWRQIPPEVLETHNSFALFFTRWITHFCAPVFFLLTGTGVVPPDDFTLRSGDVIRITIPPIGTLENRVR